MMKNFWVRTASAIVYVALIVFTTYASRWLSPLWGRIIQQGFFLWVALDGIHEFYKMTDIKGTQVNKGMGYILGAVVFLMLSNYEEWIWVQKLSVGVVPAMALLAIILQLWRHSENAFAELGMTILPVLYIAMPLSLIWPIGAVVGSENLLMMVFGLIWINDACAYMGGSLIGKHKLWQRHSPGKTWEGSLCGFVCTIVAAIFLGPWMDNEYSLMVWIGLALVCSVIGTLGDLAESMFKRSCSIKDSGHVMPGHGGVLDRFDSILASMPFVYIIIVCC